MNKKIEILEEELKQRAFDGKWQRWIKIADGDNAYTCTSETGSRMTYVPEMWVVAGVYDYLMEIAD